MFEKIGIGVDIIDISRFKNKSFVSNKIFYKKIFHDSEINYCLNFKNSSQHFAGKFAIKEAVIKSLDVKIDFLDILTDHKNSKPTVKLINNATYRFLVTVTHGESQAVAVVLSEKTK